MGMIRKTMSIGTLGLVSFRSKKELLERSESSRLEAEARLTDEQAARLVAEARAEVAEKQAEQASRRERRAAKKSSQKSAATMVGEAASETTKATRRAARRARKRCDNARSRPVGGDVCQGDGGAQSGASPRARRRGRRRVDDPLRRAPPELGSMERVTCDSGRGAPRVGLRSHRRRASVWMIRVHASCSPLRVSGDGGIQIPS